MLASQGPQLAARMVRRTAVGAPVRRMGAVAHGHGGPTKTLPPRPELNPKAGFGERLQHQLWYKRHPDYEGAEAYVRFYLPHNHQIVYAVLGLYASIGIYFTMKGKANARAALRATPAPAAPDYHTPLPVSSDIPSFGTDEWARFMEAAPENPEKFFNSLDELPAK